MATISYLTRHICRQGPNFNRAQFYTKSVNIHYKNTNLYQISINYNRHYHNKTSILSKRFNIEPSPQMIKYQSTRRMNETKTKEQPQQTTSSQTELSLSDKLKLQVKQYGSTVLVFHISISLLSLGGFYLLVSSGLDVQKWVTDWNIITGEKAEKLFAGAGTFAIAYAIHKLFAPVRMMITLSCVPFIVKYLRSHGFIKKQIDKVK